MTKKHDEWWKRNNRNAKSEKNDNAYDLLLEKQRLDHF